MRIEPTLRALADPTRLRIMRLLAAMELAIGELAQVLGQSQPRVSRHARILCDAGLAERRKEGSWVFLRQLIGSPEGPGLAAAIARLLSAAEDSDDAFAARCAEDRRNLAAIRAAREDRAAEYFAAHAEEWDRLRVLHAPDAPVEQALGKALGDDGLGALLDIGTGTGRMAELFAPRADSVVALDKSPEMLRLARARLQHLAADRLDIVQGDFAALPLDDASVDTVLFHQVLHYAQEPQVALAEAARVARDGATLAIVDFAAHEREELRQQHQHARLGFSDEQMLGLLADAGFAPEQAHALPGKPLTVKIWTARRTGGRAPTQTTRRAQELTR
ncbi:MAG: metalloregulator ArsR/SmtB family transcription factor [Sphingomonadaceae bacterium]